MQHDSTSSPRSMETIYAQTPLGFLPDVETIEQRPHLARRERLKRVLERRRVSYANTHPHVVRKRLEHQTRNGEVITLDKVLYLYGHRCYLCDEVLEQGRGTIHMDHVVPLSRGGTHTLDNLRPTCPTCNWTKQNRLWHEIEPVHPKMARRIRAIVEDAA